MEEKNDKVTVLTEDAELSLGSYQELMKLYKKCHVCRRIILKEKTLCPWCETEQ